MLFCFWWTRRPRSAKKDGQADEGDDGDDEADDDDDDDDHADDGDDDNDDEDNDDGDGYDEQPNFTTRFCSNETRKRPSDREKHQCPGEKGRVNPGFGRGQKRATGRRQWERDRSKEEQGVRGH